MKLTRIRVAANGYDYADIKDIDATLQPGGAASAKLATASFKIVQMPRNLKLAFDYANSLKNIRWDASAAKDDALPRLVNVYVYLEGAKGCDNYGAVVAY